MTRSKSPASRGSELPATQSSVPKDKVTNAPTDQGRIKLLGLVATVLSVAALTAGAFLLVQQPEDSEKPQLNTTNWKTTVQSSAVRYHVSSSDPIEYQVAVALVFGGVYALKTGFMVPGSPLFNAAAGQIFGLWAGFVIVSIANAIGAVICFSWASSMGETFLGKAGANSGDDKEAAKVGKVRAMFESLRERTAGMDSVQLIIFLTLIRQVPGAPHTLLNLALALGSIPFWPYLFSIAVGLMPFTLITVQAGAALRDFASSGSVPMEQVYIGLAIIAAIAVLGLVAKRRIGSN